jgi:hypothetical protein
MASAIQNNYATYGDAMSYSYSGTIETTAYYHKHVLVVILLSADQLFLLCKRNKKKH